MSEGRRLDVTLVALLGLTLVTWLVVDGVLSMSSLALAVFAVTSVKAVAVMGSFMELSRGPWWAFAGLALGFCGVAGSLALLLA
jgi:hypothetical protein